MSALAVGGAAADGCPGGTMTRRERGRGSEKSATTSPSQAPPPRAVAAYDLLRLVDVDGGSGSGSGERPRPLPRAGGHRPLSSTAPAQAPLPFPSTASAQPPFPPIQHHPRPSPRLRRWQSRLGPRRWSCTKGRGRARHTRVGSCPPASAHSTPRRDRSEPSEAGPSRTRTPHAVEEEASD
jgi:hypothetical protein